MFDRYVVVDWSANSTPKVGRDSIWLATVDASGSTLANPSTRVDAERLLIDELERTVDERTLIGVDFSLGYPAGTAAALGLDGPPWSSMSTRLAESTRDDARNVNNRFDVAATMNEQMSGNAAPFWGCPPARAGRYLTATKPPPDGPVGQWRTVESVLRERGQRPFSSWQLLGAGAVGSQSLLGIPMVVRLCRRFEPRVEVWPFTTGLRTPLLRDSIVVIVEVWPSLLAVPAGVASPDEVRDAAQVRAVARWLAELDASRELASLFEPGLADDVRAVVEDEEGWVLGVAG